MILSQGLTNRIRSITEGVSNGWVHMLWKINDQCPVASAQVFPGGIQGVRFSDVRAGDIYPPVDKRGPLMPIQSAWQNVWEAIRPDTLEVHPHAILFRGHHPFGIGWPDFAPQVQHLADTTIGNVVVMADSRRAEIEAILGVRMIHPTSNEMVSDGDRSPEDVTLFLQDWCRFLVAENAITNHPGSAAMWPRRFF